MLNFNELIDLQLLRTFYNTLKSKLKPNIYCTCATASSTTAKVATTEDKFELVAGATIRVKFTYTNSVASPTLNVNSTGAKSIARYGSTASLAYAWAANAIVELTYDGTRWVMTAAGSMPYIYGGASTIVNSNLTASRALVSDASGKVAVSAVTSTQLGYLSGVTNKVVCTSSGYNTKIHISATEPSMSVGDIWLKIPS